jgi:hypothetical protein
VHGKVCKLQIEDIWKKCNKPFTIIFSTLPLFTLALTLTDSVKWLAMYLQLGNEMALGVSWFKSFNTHASVPVSLKLHSCQPELDLIDNMQGIIFIWIGCFDFVEL